MHKEHSLSGTKKISKSQAEEKHLRVVRGSDEKALYVFSFLAVAIFFDRALIGRSYQFIRHHKITEVLEKAKGPSF